MRKKLSVSELPKFDAARFLRDEEDIAAYLTAALEEDDPEALIEALGTVARARGMAEIARRSGLAREALYRSLRPGANPRVATVIRVCKALGLKITLTPDRADVPSAKRA